MHCAARPAVDGAGPGAWRASATTEPIEATKKSRGARGCPTYAGRMPRELRRTTKPKGARLAAGVLLAMLCVPAVWQLWLATSVFIGRYDYPFDIDWLESSALYQAWRMMEGQHTYAEPGQGYLPLFHPIGYPALLAAVGKITGLDYAMARTLSFGAFVATLGISSVEVVRHAASQRWLGYTLALLAAGVGASCLPLVGAYYDLIRCDTISWACCAVAAAIASSSEPSRKRLGWLALVMTLGVYTRLLTVFPFLWIGLVVLWRDRGDGLRLAAYVIGACGVVLAGLLTTSGGWYWTYTVTLLQRHTVHLNRLTGGLQRVHEFLPFAAALPLVAVALFARRQLSVRCAMWVGVFIMSVPAALLPLAKDGGHDNDYMPIGLFVGPATALLIIEVSRALKTRRRFALAIPYLLATGIAAFLLSRPYDPTDYIPSATHWRRAASLNAMVAKLKGGVIAPCHPFLAIRNGHRNDQFSEMPYIDSYWSELPGLALGAYLDRAGAQWMLLTGFEYSRTIAEVATRYDDGDHLPLSPATLLGQPMRLRYVFRRRRVRANARTLFDFEQDPGDGWTREGAAFEHSPTDVTPANQQRLWGGTGERVANSFHPTMGDRAIGSLTSPPFIIDGDRLAIDLGGGLGVGAFLLIDEEVVAGLYPLLRDREVLLGTTLDVRRYRGMQARLMFNDESMAIWGHLLADEVVLFDDPGE